MWKKRVVSTFRQLRRVRSLENESNNTETSLTLGTTLHLPQSLPYVHFGNHRPNWLTTVVEEAS